MKEKISKCNNCRLCLNQLPLLDNLGKSDIMWVGLSAKRINNLNKSVPLDSDTNTGRIIQQIEKRIPFFTFYKTNLVKCLPLDENQKLRYPNEGEMDKCINNLLYEIEIVKPKKIFLLGRKTYNYVHKYFVRNKLNTSRLYYVEHPSYIYVYKRKTVNEYINKVVEMCTYEEK